MNDYISRKEAITQAHEIIKGYAGYKAWAIVDMLRKLPTADVVEVVRCKDCKYAQLTYDGDCKFCLKVTDDYDIPMTVYYSGNHYCGFGERREDE